MPSVEQEEIDRWTALEAWNEFVRKVSPNNPIKIMLSRVRELEAENAKLREALLPFAKIWIGDKDGTNSIPWGDCRRAAELMEGWK